ncbi:MAG: hypothetical protein Q9163_001485 [Psora crenata]
MVRVARPTEGYKTDWRISLLTWILTLSNLAICIHRSSRIYLFQQAQCLTYYRAFDPTQIDSQNKVEERLCKLGGIQSPLSIIEGVDSFLQLLPGIGFLPVVSRYNVKARVASNWSWKALFANGESHHDRSIPLLFSVTFFSLHQPWTTNAVLLTFLLDVVGGGDITRITICISCIAAISPPDQLYVSYLFLGRAATPDQALIRIRTKAYNYMSGLYVLASVCGSVIVPNPTFTVINIFLINGLAMRVEVLLSQYISLVLHWPLATVNAALALKALVSSLWLFALPTIRKRFLEPRMSTSETDLVITQASLMTNAVGMIGLGFAAPAPFFILALCIYTSGVGLSDSLTAFGTMTLPPGEEIPALYVRTDRNSAHFLCAFNEALLDQHHFDCRSPPNYRLVGYAQAECLPAVEEPQELEKRRSIITYTPPIP